VRLWDRLAGWRGIGLRKFLPTAFDAEAPSPPRKMPPTATRDKLAGDERPRAAFRQGTRPPLCSRPQGVHDADIDRRRGGPFLSEERLPGCIRRGRKARRASAWSKKSSGSPCGERGRSDRGLLERPMVGTRPRCRSNPFHPFSNVVGGGGPSRPVGRRRNRELVAAYVLGHSISGGGRCGFQQQIHIHRHERCMVWILRRGGQAFFLRPAEVASPLWRGQRKKVERSGGKRADKFGPQGTSPPPRGGVVRFAQHLAARQMRDRSAAATGRPRLNKRLRSTRPFPAKVRRIAARFAHAERTGGQAPDPAVGPSRGRPHQRTPKDVGPRGRGLSEFSG